MLRAELKKRIENQGARKAHLPPPSVGGCRDGCPLTCGNGRCPSEAPAVQSAIEGRRREPSPHPSSLRRHSGHGFDFARSVQSVVRSYASE